MTDDGRQMTGRREEENGEALFLGSRYPQKGRAYLEVT